MSQNVFLRLISGPVTRSTNFGPVRTGPDPWTGPDRSTCTGPHHYFECSPFQWYTLKRTTLVTIGTLRLLFECSPFQWYTLKRTTLVTIGTLRLLIQCSPFQWYTLKRTT